MKRHSNKIIKLVNKTTNVDERLLIAQKYCDRFNNTSNGYYLEFRNGILFYSRIRYGASDATKIDISEYFDLQKNKRSKIK